MKLQIFAILIILTFSLGCISTDPVSEETPINPVELDAVDNTLEEEHVEETPAPAEQQINTSPSPNEPLRIGAFNVQVFGITKASKPEVMAVLADIIRTYDIIAIQEIRDSSQTALPKLVDMVNADGSQYQYVVSERLGRTSSKEQYAYVYNSNTVQITGDPHTYPEPSGTDPFHRQPYITSFEAIGGNYDAVIMVIHADPDEATEEINALADVVTYARQAYPGEQDFIILGDFNADGSYFNENSVSSISGDGYAWVIDNTQDTTVASSSNTYDRIVLTDTSDYIDSGVFRFDTAYGLSSSQTAAVSDHYPVYVTFRTDIDNDASSPSTYVPVKTSTSTTTTTLPTSTTSSNVQSPSSSSGPVQIVGISLADEWVKIKNTGSSSVSLTGWKIMDEGDKHTYTFPSFTLTAGATVTLHTVSGTNTATDLYWGKKNVWNNDGDTARLYDSSGNFVSTSK
jgi:endonuclease/exonuclease/phosphatase family metal-dependent hydrolase